jgi:hypothetical protein
MLAQPDAPAATGKGGGVKAASVGPPSPSKWSSATGVSAGHAPPPLAAAPLAHQQLARGSSLFAAVSLDTDCKEVRCFDDDGRACVCVLRARRGDLGARFPARACATDGELQNHHTPRLPKIKLFSLRAPPAPPTRRYRPRRRSHR